MTIQLPQLFGPNQVPLTFTREVGSGGEGAVYELVGHPQVLVKVFHGTPDRERESKLRAMAAMSALVAYPRIAWPLWLVHDQAGRLRGYGMRRLRGVSLVPLTAPVLMKRRLPHWTQPHVVRACYELAGLCEQVENHGVFIVDMSLMNFVVDPRSAEVFALDAEAFAIFTAGKHFPSSVYTRDYQTPEILSGRVPLARFGAPQFRGAAASLLFTLLTAGGQPYASRDGLTIEETIVQGRYIMGGKGVARGCTNNVTWERYRALPPRICALFKRAFISGHTDPSARPGFAEWQAALAAYYQDLLRRN